MRRSRSECLCFFEIVIADKRGQITKFELETIVCAGREWLSGISE